MSSSRPQIAVEQVWCELCNRPVDEFDESASHNLWGKPDATGHHRGYIMIRAYCHQDEADIKLSFTDARAHAGQRIVAFVNGKAVTGFPVTAFPSPPLLLMESAAPLPSIQSKVTPCVP